MSYIIHTRKKKGRRKPKPTLNPKRAHLPIVEIGSYKEAMNALQLEDLLDDKVEDVDQTFDFLLKELKSRAPRSPQSIPPEVIGWLRKAHTWSAIANRFPEHQKYCYEKMAVLFGPIRNNYQIVMKKSKT